mmetsp:Transcript_31818/g.77542  ORF Transcript_31818/g.77542 Transcript_31818/m.77542 type:complete len:223 (-) Transcript_31818:1617-2285(-)
MPETEVALWSPLPRSSKPLAFRPSSGSLRIRSDNFFLTNSAVTCGHRGSTERTISSGFVLKIWAGVYLQSEANITPLSFHSDDGNGFEFLLMEPFARSRSAVTGPRSSSKGIRSEVADQSSCSSRSPLPYPSMAFCMWSPPSSSICGPIEVPVRSCVCPSGSTTMSGCISGGQRPLADRAAIHPASAIPCCTSLRLNLDFEFSWPGVERRLLSSFNSICQSI